MKKIIVISVASGVIILGLFGLYFYFSAPATQPSQDSQNSVLRLPESNNSSQKVLHIAPLESKATYELNEVLRGTKTHVVGSTGDIAGDISLTLTKPQKIEIGQVKVNARTFKTDIEQRDENVIKLVLKSNDPANEFIAFKTTNITGVPESIESNKDFSVAIIGDITIAGVTKSVTFDGTANLSDANVLKINASTMLAREDFGVFIPNFSFLANVDKIVKLSISLIAR